MDATTNRSELLVCGHCNQRIFRAASGAWLHYDGRVYCRSSVAQPAALCPVSADGEQVIHNQGNHVETPYEEPSNPVQKLIFPSLRRAYREGYLAAEQDLSSSAGISTPTSSGDDGERPQDS